MTDFAVKDDGSVEILIVESGLPYATALFPTICYKTEDRLKKIEHQLDVLALQGRFVEGWKWIRNPAFDTKNEKTTAEIKFRMCKNEDEANLIAEKIKKIIKDVQDGKD
jgi:hypothetical protein